MKTLFLDCEWNSFGGEFIAIALVSPEGEAFYRAVQCLDPHPWVVENVLPVLGTETVTKELLQSELEQFLNQWGEVHIVADWPEDFIYFNALLLTGPGKRIKLPHITMEIDLELRSVSEVPHNALFDAIANCKARIGPQK